MLIESVWRWLVVGVVVSALITWLVPENSLASVPGMTGMTAMIATLILSVPLYVCATASVPIAAALVASGLPGGAALVFLMAGPATNVATLGAVYRNLGKRALLFYLATIIVGSILAGLLFDGLISSSAATMMHHDHTGGMWRQLCTIVFCGLIAWCAVQDLRHWWRSRTVGRSASEDALVPVQTLEVQGMTCQGCANRLARVLESVDGVSHASVSFDDRRAVVSGKASVESLVEATVSAGFTANADSVDADSASGDSGSEIAQTVESR
jgi:copper chaperone CopZ